VDTEYSVSTLYEYFVSILHRNSSLAQIIKTSCIKYLARRLQTILAHECTGLKLDTHSGVTNSSKRASDRRDITLPARLTWKDQRGTTRFAAVVTRNVSEYGVYVECHSPVSIPLYRLVQFQLERDSRCAEALPGHLLHGRVLSAVYRVSPPAPNKPQGLALRLMVDPRRVTTPVSANIAQVLAS
jgi:hypothetical protein